MNYAHFGKLNVDWLIKHAEPPFLLIADPATADAFLSHFRARLFDPYKHSFDLLQGMNYRKACELVETLRYLFPAGETTLTREEADHLILEALLDYPPPTTLKNLIPDSNDPGQRKARRLIERLYLSPVLRTTLTGKQFDFSNSVVLSLDRAKLGSFDALALSLFLVGQHKGQIILSDFVLYGRSLHAALIEEGRLTCSVRRLDSLPEALKDELLLIENKTASGTTYEDAVLLADYLCKFRPGTDGYNTFIDETMGNASRGVQDRAGDPAL